MTTDQDLPDADAPTGDYVHHPDYLEMRLRMAVTGTASPSDEVWARALGNLLRHLEQHPLPTKPRTVSEERLKRLGTLLRFLALGRGRKATLHVDGREIGFTRAVIIHSAVERQIQPIPRDEDAAEDEDALPTPRSVMEYDTFDLLDPECPDAGEILWVLGDAPLKVLIEGSDADLEELDLELDQAQAMTVVYARTADGSMREILQISQPGRGAPIGVSLDETVDHLFALPGSDLPHSLEWRRVDGTDDVQRFADVGAMKRRFRELVEDEPEAIHIVGIATSDGETRPVAMFRRDGHPSLLALSPERRARAQYLCAGAQAQHERRWGDKAIGRSGGRA